MLVILEDGVWIGVINSLFCLLYVKDKEPQNLKEKLATYKLFKDYNP